MKKFYIVMVVVIAIIGMGFREANASSYIINSAYGDDLDQIERICEKYEYIVAHHESTSQYILIRQRFSIDEYDRYLWIVDVYDLEMNEFGSSTMPILNEDLDLVEETIDRVINEI